MPKTGGWFASAENRLATIDQILDAIRKGEEIRIWTDRGNRPPEISLHHSDRNRFAIDLNAECFCLDAIQEAVEAYRFSIADAIEGAYRERADQGPQMQEKTERPPAPVARPR